jgi:uracil-DNA glycosylase family 4
MSSSATYCPDMAGETPQPLPQADSWQRLRHDIVTCRACPRLVTWREQVANEKRAAYRDQTYWGRPVPGFGDHGARLLVLGLAPAAHGANRTGRIFTGDRSGDWLYRGLHRAGLANQPTSQHVEDGLELAGVWVAAAVRCAPPGNKPTPDERDACRPFLTRELALLDELRAVLCLGAFGWAAAVRELGVRPAPRFGHGAVAQVAWQGRTLTLVGSFHPSQQNTFTGRLTEAMFDDAIATAAQAAGLSRPARRRGSTPSA